jgi:uncharacterized lipoprotein YajG
VVFDEGMKTSLLGLLAAIVFLAGCATPRERVDTVHRSATGLEHKTDEFVESSDADLRQHMDQWARDGWNVHWISPRIVQPDGTVLRRAELSRKQK